MTIKDAVGTTNVLTHNDYSIDEMICWLSQIDFMVKRLIIDAHEGATAVTFTGYKGLKDWDTELLVPAPFDEVYLRWLESQIFYHNAEYDKYNNAIIMFNTVFDAYKSYYIQMHPPLNRGHRFMF